MKIRLLSVCQKLPDWVEEGIEEYRKRLPKNWPVEDIRIPLAKRSKNSTPEASMEAEGEKILQRLAPNETVITLEITGQTWSTPQLVTHLKKADSSGQPVSFVIGGPDGLANIVRKRADLQFSLSRLTLPHPLVHVVLMEAVYRGYSIIHGHPYHK